MGGQELVGHILAYSFSGTLNSLHLSSVYLAACRRPSSSLIPTRTVWSHWRCIV